MSSEHEQSSKGSQSSGGLHGRFDYTLDAKRRFTIPADWRDAMGSPTHVYIMPDPSKQYLHLLTPEEMERSFSMLQNRELFDEDLDDALSVIGEHVEQAKLDVQGRIRIRDHLLDHAMIEDKIVMIGAKGRAQLWSPKLRPETGAVKQAEFAAAYRKLRSLMRPRER